MRLSLLLIPFLHLHTSVGSVHLERIGPASVSKNCDNKPCFQGKCVGDKCRCFAGWGGQQCDRCYGRSLLTNQSEVLTDGPRNYSSSSRCMWVIDTPQSHGPLLLKLDSFVTECSWDHVYVYDGLGVYGQQLAAYSGTMSGVELSVRSGKALVYFFSDLAFNMHGFNISFAHNRCIADCNMHGTCIQGVCHCEEAYQGTACEHHVCTHNLTALPDAGACSSAGVCKQDLTCECNKRYHGDRCQAPTTEAVIDKLYPDNTLGARASHASVLGNETTIWIVGGAHFSGSNYSMVVIYNVSDATWQAVDTKNTPQPRYDHSLVNYKNKLYMFGGVVSERNISDELWALDMISLEWTLVKPDNNKPDAVAGHTAHVIADQMLVFYGYNPYQGYIHRIQKFHFGTSKWSDVTDKGPEVQGRFGHSLVAYGHDKKEVVLIYGGYMPPNDAAYSTITDSLVQYTCSSQGCVHKTLSSGIAAVFRHSASLLNGMMLVIGGNGHNESTSTRTHDCYSGLIQAYDVECDSWLTVHVRDGVLLERYGHSSLATPSNVFITGGFSGVMLADVIKFTPGECGDLKRPEECRTMRQGIRCLQSEGQCVPVESDVSYPHSFTSLVKLEQPKTELDCPYNYHKSKTWCSEKECDSCLQIDGCSWCYWSGECVITENTCKDGTIPISQPSRCSRDEPRPCAYAHDCFSCKRMTHCSWFLMNDSKWKCITTQEMILEEEQLERSTTSRALAVLGTARNMSTCPSACAMHDSCEVCIQQQCMWCPTNKRCVSMDAYMVSFPYGQCQSWITAVNTVSNQHACQWDPSDCSKQKTCAECERVGPKCGWCDDGSGTGLGTCLAGSLQAPLNASLCATDGKASWHFTNCSACQCNGHSNCTTHTSVHDGFAEQCCNQCSHNTTGDHCQLCADGFYGDARNGGHCQECHCNGQATTCQRESGDCFCTTKGVTGKNCSKCEQKYYGDPENNQPCYYELTVDFIFTFKLDQDDPKDKYVNQINFFSTPHKRDTDVQFTVVCESPKGHKAYVSMSINSSLFEGHPGMSKPLMARTVCDENGIRRTYSANSEPGFVFGTDANTTFLVKVHNFSTPIKIQISFSQSPPINWVLFFVIFAACFVVLLVVAGLLWMIKLRIEVFRRNQRRYDEIEQMASRPFASVRLELASSTANLMATPIAVEPCSNYRAGVFTVAVRLPTGGKHFTPHGTSGLAVASALCLLTQAQLGVLQAPDTTDHQHNRKTTLMRYIPFIRS